jgi:capsular polysaccharide biosynthesis protein
LLQTPTYEASVRILIGQKNPDTRVSSLAGDVQGLQQLTPTIAKAVTTFPVAQAVTEQLDLPTESASSLLKNLTAKQETGTMFIRISYTDADPERSEEIANSTAEVFSKQVSELSPGGNTITATVWEPATLPQTPVTPNPLRNSLLALGVGIVLGVVLAFLLEYRDSHRDFA